MLKIKFVGFAFIALSISSCTKERTCSCKYADGSSAGTYKVTDTRSRAKKSCEALTTSVQTCKLN